MKTLIIENGRTKIKDREFAGSSYEEIIISDSVTSIGNEAFKACKNLKKLSLSKNLKLLGNAAFSQCSHLASVEIPESLTYLPRLCFAECTKLKKIKLNDNMTYFDHYALFKCQNLETFKLPTSLSYLGIKALAKCNMIKSITIPASLENIEYAALSEMRTLEKIQVQDENPKYRSFDGKSLIDIKDNVFIQYAIGNDGSEYTIYNFPVYYDDVQSFERFYHIADYAFAGAHNLKQLNITGSVESIGANTFKNMNCTNLKILMDAYSDNIIFTIGSLNDHPHVPFTNIEIEEGITSLSSNLFELFKEAKTIKLPNTLVQIGSNVFSKSKNLKELYLAKSIKSIDPETFPDGIDLHFEDFKDIKSQDFLTLQTKVSDEAYFSYFDKDNMRIFFLKDGSYYVKVDDYSYISISKDEIRSFSSNSNLVENNPGLFVEHFFKLYYLYLNYTKAFFNIFNNKNIYNIFNKLLSDMDNIEEITGQKLRVLISEILNEENHFDELLLNGLLMRNVSKDELLFILKKMNNSLERFLKQTDYLKVFSERSFLNQKYYDLTYIINYCQLLDDYQIKDNILFNDNIAVNLPYEDQVLLVKYYNKNIRRLLIKSKVINNSSIVDLMKLMKIMGVFSDDPILSQKVTTFLNEKVIGDNDTYSIVGDNIHRIFNEFRVRDDIDYEFIKFFIENYKKLISLEKSYSGFITKIYNNFEEIKRFSTSNRGEQKRIKVTLDKCLHFFLIKTFKNVNENNKDLAIFLGKFFHEDGVLTKAEEILALANKTRRNIFTNDNSCKSDIRGEIDGYTYEWLPKQDWYNLVLGKYCNCCAHIQGNGAGIMLASMIDDDVQNLVIKDQMGLIIAKGTLYVNRDQGYGIVNTIETNSFVTDEVKTNIIYPAFMQGIKEFIDIYNVNNLVPLNKITVGTNQNALLDILEDKGHKNTDLLNPINYSEYQYVIDDKTYGAYNGDAYKRQLLLYKK